MKERVEVDAGVKAVGRLLLDIRNIAAADGEALGQGPADRLGGRSGEFPDALEDRRVDRGVAGHLLADVLDDLVDEFRVALLEGPADAFKTAILTRTGDLHWLEDLTRKCSQSP